MLNFKKGPDVTQATKVGEPTLVDPKQTGAPELIRAANASVMSALAAATGTAKPGTGTAAPPANAAAPHPEGATGTATATEMTPATGTTANTGVEVVNKPAGGAPDGGIEDLGNDLKPPTSPPTDAPAPPLPPTQVNDAPKAAAPSSTTGSADAASQPAAPADTNTESSSKKKKKKHLFPF